MLDVLNQRIFVASPCRENAPCDGYFDSLYQLTLPNNSKIQRAVNNDPTAAMNRLVENALEEKFDYIFFVDDDQMFEPNIVMNLLMHDVDVICGVYLFRNPPFGASIFNKVLPGNAVEQAALRDEPPGLYEIKSAGMSGVLIKCSVFEKLEKPYFRNFEWQDGVRFGEDIMFFQRLREAGFKIHCDTTQTLWHLVKAFIAPEYKDGSWRTCVRIGGTSIHLQR